MSETVADQSIELREEGGGEVHSVKTSLDLYSENKLVITR